MPAFPNGSTWPITSYELVVDTFTPYRANISPEALVDAMRRRGTLPRYPQQEHIESATDAHGWAGFGPDDAPEVCGSMFMLMRRSFVKRLPKNTIKEMVEERCDEKRSDMGLPPGTRLPAAIRREITDEITEEVARETMPNLRNIGVCIDTATMRFFVLANGSGAEGIANEVVGLVADAAGVPPRERPRAVQMGRRAQTIAAYTHSGLPDGLNRLFMADLLGHMNANDYLTVEGVRGFAVAPGDKVVMSTEGNQRVSATGETETERLLDARIDDDDAAVTRMVVEITDEVGSWSFTINDDAHLLRVVMPPVTYDKNEEADRRSNIMLRVDMCWRAVEMQQALIHAFLVTQVRRMVTDEPQVFPIRHDLGHASARWSAVGEEQPAADARQGTMFPPVRPETRVATGDDLPPEWVAPEPAPPTLPEEPPVDRDDPPREDLAPMECANGSEVAVPQLSEEDVETLRNGRFVGAAALWLKAQRERTGQTLADACRSLAAVVDDQAAALAIAVGADHAHTPDLDAPAPESAETIEQALGVIQRHVKPGGNPVSALTTHMRMGWKRAGALCDYLRRCGLIEPWPTRKAVAE